MELMVPYRGIKWQSETELFFLKETNQVQDSLVDAVDLSMA